MSASLSSFRAAWRAGVPLVAIQTADPAATMRGCYAALNGKQDATALIQMDTVSGVQGALVGAGRAANALGEQVAAEICGEVQPNTITNPAEWLSMVASAGKKLKVRTESGSGRTIIFLHHLNRLIGELPITQGLWNCRDAIKPQGAMIVALGPSFTIPAELRNDVVVITDPLPDAAELSGIVDSVAKDAKLEAIPDRDKVVDSLTGVSAFGAEQLLAMSITKEGIDQDMLTERQRKMIEQTPGLSVWRGGESFDQVGGLANLKAFLRRVLKSGTTPIRAVLFGDEIEKQLAGIAGDTSGTSQDQLGALLQYIQDKKIPMMILVGHGGTGKSAIAKATGSEAGCPVLALDFGAMKGGLVGQSEERIRAALGVASSVSNDKLIIILTCNKLDVLPPEFKRRATLGTFFVDLPTDEERSVIWPIHLKACQIPEQPLPDDTNWTGAEIRACCDIAYRTGYTLKEAARFVVPIAKSGAEQVAALRRLANNRFISASYPGPYQLRSEAETATGLVMERS